jgi:hypothetical protein
MNGTQYVEWLFINRFLWNCDDKAYSIRLWGPCWNWPTWHIIFMSMCTSFEASCISWIIITDAFTYLYRSSYIKTHQARGTLPINGPVFIFEEPFYCFYCFTSAALYYHLQSCIWLEEFIKRDIIWFYVFVQFLPLQSWWMQKKIIVSFLLLQGMPL